MTTQTEALDMITKLRLAHQAMEAACERIDQLKAENKALKEALAQEKALQALHDENERLGLYKDAYAKPEEEPLSKIESAAAKAVNYRSEYQKPLTVRLQQLADRYDFFKEEVHRLESALAKRKNEPNELLLRRVMARLADLLDEDQFADIESIVTSVGVSPPQPKEPEQKPVARVVEHGATVKLEWANADAAHNAKVGNLYTTPQQRTWVGLTDEEIEDIELGCRSTPFGKIEAMRMVEAKLKEKNT